MSTFALRTADAGDAGAIAALHTANWRSTYAGILDPAYLAGPVEEDRRAVWHERLTAGPDDLEVVVAESEQGSPACSTSASPAGAASSTTCTAPHRCADRAWARRC